MQFHLRWPNVRASGKGGIAWRLRELAECRPVLIVWLPKQQSSQSPYRWRGTDRGGKLSSSATHSLPTISETNMTHWRASGVRQRETEALLPLHFQQPYQTADNCCNRVTNLACLKRKVHQWLFLASRPLDDFAMDLLVLSPKNGVEILS